MAGLLYKELILNKKNFLYIGLGIVLFTVFSFIPFGDDFDGAEVVCTFILSMMCLLIFLMTGTIESGLFAHDERKKWADFVCSTPLSVKGQVLSKYYFSLLISIATFVYCNLIFGINDVIQGRTSGIMNVALIAFLVQINLRSFEFPFLIRFGSKYGNNYRIALLGVIFFIAFVYMLFGDTSIFGTFDDFMKWFTSLLNGEFFTDYLLVVSALSPFFVGLLYFLSYKISCRLYLKGVECYDK